MGMQPVTLCITKVGSVFSKSGHEQKMSFLVKPNKCLNMSTYNRRLANPPRQRRKTAAALACFLLLPVARTLAAAAGETPLPSLHMHVFTEAADSIPDDPVSHTDSSPAPNLHMVVFNDKASAEADMLVPLNRQQPALPATAAPVADTPGGNDFDFAVYLQPGYRIDDIRWNIASPTGTPNILSELTWDNVESAQLKAGFGIQTPWHVVLQGSAAYGRIFSGKNQDSDYFGDNRTLEFSRSNNRTDAGNTLDLSTGIGYQFAFTEAAQKNPWLTLTPLFGYSYHEQNLKITDGVQTIPAYDPFPGLDSRYDTIWRGPWIGFESTFQAMDNLDFFGNLEYHWVSYEAKANWNLRSDLQHPVSFRHDADGYGVTLSAGGRYHFNALFSLSLSLDYQYWLADENGIDTVYTSRHGVLTTRFNEVKWNAFGVNLGIELAF